MSYILNNRQILAVEDDALIQQIICQSLERAGATVTIVDSGQAAIAHLRSNLPDAIVLDKGLPDIDGFEWLSRLRASSRRELSILPVLLLTAAAMQDDKLGGFEVGADDYMTKPFDPKELRARLTALIKRCAASPTETNLLQLEGLLIDKDARRVRCADKELKLNPHEFELLYTLARRPGNVVTRGDLMEQVFDYPAGVESRTIDVHISRLRRKLRVDNGRQVIETVHGVGYKLSTAN